MPNRCRAATVLLLFLPSLALGACGDDDGGTPAGAAGAMGAGNNTGAQGSLEGTYNGTYSGDSSGPVTMVVKAGGDTDVTVGVGGTNYPANAKIGNGALTAGVGVAGGIVVTFTGSFATAGSSASGGGNWTSTAGQKGTWTVSR